MRRKIKRTKQNVRRIGGYERRKTKRLSLWLILIVILPIVFGGGAYYVYRNQYNEYLRVYQSYQPAFAPGDIILERANISLDRSFNLLLLGLDQKSGGHIKADAVFIVHYDSTSKHFQLFELPNKVYYHYSPRNTYVELVNIYATGQLKSPESGYSTLQAVIEQNLAIKIDGYFALDLIGFERIVRGLGNVVVQNSGSFLDNDLIEDGVRGEYEKGSLSLNTEDLISFIRADEGGFYEKSNRHYSVIKSLLGNQKPRILVSGIGGFEAIDEHIYSNLEGETFRQFVRRLSSDGSFKFSYYQLDSVLSRSDKLDKDYFDKNKFDDFVTSTFDNGEVVREQARIEIYNSTSISGLASKYKRILQNMGCDIIRMANTGINASKTIIVTENPEKFPLTITKIQESFPTDVEVVQDGFEFVTTGDIIVILAEDVESI